MTRLSTKYFMSKKKAATYAILTKKFLLKKIIYFLTRLGQGAAQKVCQHSDIFKS